MPTDNSHYQWLKGFNGILFYYCNTPVGQILFLSINCQVQCVPEYDGGHTMLRGADIFVPVVDISTQ